jgi:hypothetical protein
VNVLILALPEADLAANYVNPLGASFTDPLIEVVGLGITVAFQVDAYGALVDRSSYQPLGDGHLVPAFYVLLSSAYPASSLVGPPP